MSTDSCPRPNDGELYPEDLLRIKVITEWLIGLAPETVRQQFRDDFPAGIVGWDDPMSMVRHVDAIVRTMCWPNMQRDWMTLIDEWLESTTLEQRRLDALKHADVV